MFAGVAGRALPRNASHSRRPLLDGVGIIGADTTRAADGVGAVALAHGADSDSRGSRTFYHWGEWPGGDRVMADQQVAKAGSLVHLGKPAPSARVSRSPLPTACWWPAPIAKGVQQGRVIHTRSHRSLQGYFGGGAVIG